MKSLSALNKSGITFGVAGIAGCIFGALVHSSQFYEGYLQAYGFWLMISIGCLGLLQLHDLTGGRWGRELQPMLEAGVRTLPYMALFLVPIGLLGLTQLYVWARPDALSAVPIVAQKVAWLNRPFFLGRLVFYFAVWLGLGFLLLKKGPKSSNFLTGLGTILLVLTWSFAAFDLYMSLEPEWFSSLYGGIFVVGALLSTFSFLAVVTGWYREGAEADHLHDIGKFMLMSVMLWAYLSFSQYLIIWSAKIPEEMTWYVHRGYGGWQYVGLALIVFHFAVPFTILLQRDLKRRASSLVKVALAILLVRLLDFWWFVSPAFHPGKLVFPIWMPVAFVAIGGIWLWRFSGALQNTVRGGAGGH